MNRKVRSMNLLGLSAAGYAVMSGSILLMPLPALGILPGILFWLGFLAGTAGQILLGRARRNAPLDMQSDGKLPGVFVFFSGRAAGVVDTVLMILVVWTAIVLTCGDNDAYGCYVLMAATMLAFCLHCMINGKNYLYAMKRTRRKQETPSKKKGGTVEK